MQDDDLRSSETGVTGEPDTNVDESTERDSLRAPVGNESEQDYPESTRADDSGTPDVDEASAEESTPAEEKADAEAPNLEDDETAEENDAGAGTGDGEAFDESLVDEEESDQGPLGQAAADNSAFPVVGAGTEFAYYAVNLQGPYHAEKEIPCQDSFAVEDKGSFIVAAVADGLGILSLSHIGSRTAATTAVRHCAENFDSAADLEDALALIRRAYRLARQAIWDRADEDGQSASEYDTTLALAIWTGTRAYWGQSGDSGIVVASATGKYFSLTRKQNDEEGHVYSLLGEEGQWEFGVADNVASIALATDGILNEEFCPPLPGNPTSVEVDTKQAKKFLHPHLDVAAKPQEIQPVVGRFFRNYDSRLLNDDKTLLVVYRPKALPGLQDPEYYAGFDRAEINRKRHESLYQLRATS